jgi:hypothetical protein
MVLSFTSVLGKATAGNRKERKERKERSCREKAKPTEAVVPQMPALSQSLPFFALFAFFAVHLPSAFAFSSWTARSYAAGPKTMLFM